MIHFVDVSKAFGSQPVLSNVSFVVHRAERVGIVGPNGAGKSSIFGLLTGAISPDTGQIRVPDRMVIGYVRQQLNAHDTDETLLGFAASPAPEIRQMQRRIQQLQDRLAVLEPGKEQQRVLRQLGEEQTAFEGMGAYHIETRAKAVLSGLGFAVADFESPFRSFSGGWQMRAELARTLVLDPGGLLLDEPTNYLDVPAVEWLRDYLRDFSGTLLLVSHDRYLLNSLTSKTLEVVATHVTTYNGSYSWYVEHREQRLRQLAAAKENQDRKKQQLERFVERFRAKNTKASQAQSRMKVLEKMEDIHVPRPAARAARIVIPEPPRPGAEVARLDDAGLTYDGQRWVFRNVDLRIERGDKVALVGLNGTGKTTLLRVLSGRLDASEGRVSTGHKVEIGYQAQDFADVLDPAESVFATVRKTAVDRSDGDVRALLGCLGFSGDTVEKKVGVLSGGEKVRVALGRLLVRPVNFLILDEPTTHLDIQAREALEQALRSYQGALCLVSHDVEFVRHVATTIFALGPDGVTRYYGGYDYYLEKCAAERSASSGTVDRAAAPVAGDRRAQRRAEARRRQELYQLRRPLDARISQAELRLEQLEEEQAGLLRQLETTAGGEAAGRVSRRLGEIQVEVEAATQEWETASIELEELLEDN